MATLARATQSAIDVGDRETVRLHFRFVDDLLGRAAPDVLNAIYVSYLENLRFDDREEGTADARELLSPRLRDTLAEIEEFWSNVFAGSSS